MSETKDGLPLDWHKIADQPADALVQERRNSVHPDELTDEALETYVRTRGASQ